MAYWRMQLHPSKPNESVRFASESLAFGFVGLDFKRDPGDLKTVAQDALPLNQRDYWTFAHDLQVGDKVLVIAHHFPFALVTIAGEYNYMRRPAPELGVWFRHFRRIERPALYYADHLTNVRKWEQLIMTDTISPLHDPMSKSHLLIDDWLRAHA